jgi:hypothetical protein
VVNRHADGGEIEPAPGVSGGADRIGAAAAQRRRRRWRRELAAEDLTVGAVLLGALHDPAGVGLHTVSGATVRGRVEAVGSDVVVVASASRRAWCALDAVEAVEVRAATPGDPADRCGLTLADALSHLVHGPALTVTTRGANRLHGTAVAVGEVLVLRCEAPPREALVPVGAVCVVDAPAVG